MCDYPSLGIQSTEGWVGDMTVRVQGTSFGEEGIDGTRAPLNLRGTFFVRTWAAAHIIHLAGATESRLDTPWNALVVLSALVLLRHPDRGRWLLLMASAQIVDAIAEMPFSPDHWMLLTFVNAAVLIAMALCRSTGESALSKAFPAARVILLIAYSAAAIAKYNTTFLDPITSCATAIANAASFGLTNRIGDSPVWLIATIACETAIPVLLVIPRTRRIAVRLGYAFHFVLSASPAFAMVDFTAALYALFLLFLPVGDLVAMSHVLARLAGRSSIVRHVRRAPIVALALLLTAFGLLGYVDSRISSSVVFVVVEIYLLTLLIACLSSFRVGLPHEPVGGMNWAYMPLLLLVVLWALSPYLGLRTVSVFTMFSNLRTEGPAPNHLFIPSLQLLGWQRDLVAIERSSDPAHAATEDATAGVPLMGLRRLAQDDPDLRVEGSLHGEMITLGSGSDAEPLAPLAGWEYKFLLFRPVGLGERRFCGVS